MIKRVVDWYLARHELQAIPMNSLPDYVTVQARTLTPVALSEIRKQEALCITGQSGEYKRHQVYATLIKQYPSARKRDIGMAIERAMSRIA